MPGHRSWVTRLAAPSRAATRAVGHVPIVFDAVFAAMTLDALLHPGPASQARIDHGSCLRAYPDGVDPAVASANIATLYANAYASVFGAPRTDREPPLRSYAQSGS